LLSLSLQLQESFAGHEDIDIYEGTLSQIVWLIDHAENTTVLQPAKRPISQTSGFRIPPYVSLRLVWITKADNQPGMAVQPIGPNK
jgi:hypothetical protein